MKFKKFNFKNVNSTNDIAIRLIKKTNNKFGVIVADKQKKGRGRFGRKWISYKGNLFVSIFFSLDKMNLSLNDIGGGILVVSQFSLHSLVKKGNRPSYINSAGHEIAIPLYEYFIKLCEEKIGRKVISGEFGADMKVSLINDGPVTIVIDSKVKD